jgi:hypothetical protein
MQRSTLDTQFQTEAGRSSHSHANLTNLKDHTSLQNTKSGRNQFFDQLQHEAPKYNSKGF